MKDFSFWKEYEGNSEGSGRSEKIWLINPDTNQIGLFKFKKDRDTTDHVSECLAYQLAQLLEIPCAKFELGQYWGREGSMSYNIIQTPDEILIEGINFINYIYPQYDAEKFIDIESGDKYSIEMLQKVLSKFIDFNEFLKIPLFDYLIGNTDRHQSNWAILWDGKIQRFSPLYDNSSSLCAYLPENQIEAFMGKDMLRWKSLVETKSKSLIRRTIDDLKRPTHVEMLQYIRDNYYEATKSLVEKIILVITDENIERILDLYKENELSSRKKIIIKKYLNSKVEKMKEIYFGEEE